LEKHSREKILKYQRIEFAGFPGAGKTTISSRLNETMRADGYRTLYQPEIEKVGRLKMKYYYYTSRYFPLSLFAWSQMKSKGRAGPFTFARENIGLKEEIKRSVMIFQRRQRWLQKQKESDTPFLLDQGLIQATYFMGTYGREANQEKTVFPEDEIKKWLFLEEVGDAVIFVDISPEQTIERIEGRNTPGNPWDSLERDTLRKQLEASRELMDRLKDMLHVEGKKVIVLDSTKEVDENVRQLRKELGV
jgi:thymidylate kinase